MQQAKQVLDEKSRKLNDFSIQVTQLQAHVDKVSEENKKNRSSLEKKEKKIDDLEEKLWHTEEELKLERQRSQEQQSQVYYSLKCEFSLLIAVYPLLFILRIWSFGQPRETIKEIGDTAPHTHPPKLFLG